VNKNNLKEEWEIKKMINHKYKSVITKRIFKSIRKIGICFLALAFFSPLMMLSGTNANFFDQEKSENNVFSASTLDFSVSSSVDFSPKVSPSMEVIRTVSIAKEGFLDFEYGVSADNFSGDDDLCSALEIKDDLDEIYQPLKTYFSHSSTNNRDKTDWVFTIKLNSANSDLADETCDFDLVFEAWQESLAYGAGGFFDKETVSSSVESEYWTNIANHLVVNEVYYDVASDKGSEGDNEWVEIYNPTSSTVNLKDWQICDNSSCDTISAVDLEIPANGYAVITNSTTTWDFWTVPGSAIKIALGNNIGGGLSNAGDRVILRDDSGVEIDAMSYGTDIYAFNPACPDVSSSGHSLARKPAGQDTNTRDDFEELSSPNPGTNPHTVVMNEIMPNPIGDDDEKMPGGEWVELYNYGEFDVDLSDWKLENDKGDDLKITEENTSSGSLIIGKGEFLVIYRNGDKDFNLDDDGDELRLIDEQGLIKDSHKFESTLEGKTIARFPDAVGPWIDPDPTPGDENEMNDNVLLEQILYAGNKCFDEKGSLKNKGREAVCQVEYLRFLGLIIDLDDEKINFELWEKVNKKEDEEKQEQDEEIVEEVLVSDEQGIFEDKKEEGTESSDSENENQNETEDEIGSETEDETENATGDEEKEENPVLGEGESDENPSEIEKESHGAGDEEKKEELEDEPVKKNDEEEDEEETKEEVKEEEKKETEEVE
jgi:hypothetical protein